MATDQEQAHKSHRSHKSGASSKKKKKNHGSLEQDAKERNPKVLESGHHFLSVCLFGLCQGFWSQITAMFSGRHLLLIHR